MSFSNFFNSIGNWLSDRINDIQVIIFALLPDSPFQFIPERYGPHQTVYSRFCKWRDDGTLLRIFQALSIDADFENLSIDSTSIKAHPQSAGAKRGL